MTLFSVRLANVITGGSIQKSGGAITAHNVGDNSLGSIHTCDLLGTNYSLNYSLNHGLYCTKWAYSHLIFGQLLHVLKSSIKGCVHILSIK